MADEWLRSGIGKSTPDAITIRGRDLATELMGQVSFTELAFFLPANRMPTAGETRLFDAALVSLADHGLTPSVLAARLTWTGATESLQGSVAAGLLGAGNVFLGVVEDTARFLAAVLAGVEAGVEAGEQAAAERAVRAEIAAGRRIPGLGHPVHRVEDPRTPRLYAIAAETRIPTPHLRALRAVADAHAAATGKRLPINGAGAAGAAFADLGFPPGIVRGFALLARTAGLVAHLAEEMTDPIGRRLWLDVEHRVNRASAGDVGEVQGESGASLPRTHDEA